MKSKSIVLLALALGCGLIASIGISQVMDRRNVPDGPVNEMEPVFVAAKDINYNDKMTPEIIRLEEWPKGKVPAGAITNLDAIKDKRSGTKLFAGEPILTGKLMGSDGNGAAPKIPQGYRVVSVRVDAVTGASSLILPDDRVDVLVYMARNPGTGVNETTTKTILQDIRVFAADTQFERRHGQDEPTIAAKTISLLVTPAQAEKVTLATEMGSIRLVLRGPDDNAEARADGANIHDIFGVSEQADRQNENPRPSPAVAQVQPVAEPVGQQAPRHNWKMVLLEGSELREVELNGDEAFPDAPAQFKFPAKPISISDPAATSETPSQDDAMLPGAPELDVAPEAETETQDDYNSQPEPQTEES